MAVIQRTECRGLSIRLLRQGIIWGLLLGAARCGPPGCEQAKKDAEAASLPGTWLQDKPGGKCNQFFFIL